ncbi:MAG TPA: hypothetical protein VHZ02_16500, partial [Acidimicrobiales bacterium]|nr:hypothetical protein [Acidimicrobiales bacterium]
SVPVTVEEEYFPPPPELRDLLRGLGATVSLLAASPVTDAASILFEDRTTAAADVLRDLAV